MRRFWVGLVVIAALQHLLVVVDLRRCSGVAAQRATNGGAMNPALSVASASGAAPLLRLPSPALIATSQIDATGHNRACALALLQMVHKWGWCISGAKIGRNFLTKLLIALADLFERQLVCFALCAHFVLKRLDHALTLGARVTKFNDQITAINPHFPVFV